MITTLAIIALACWIAGADMEEDPYKDETDDDWADRQW